MTGVNYIEVYVDRATNLPKMDAGLGSCDPYCMVVAGMFRFRSPVVRNSLDPVFQQTFRMNVSGDEETEIRCVCVCVHVCVCMYV